jgi:hypothetical protein
VQPDGVGVDFHQDLRGKDFNPTAFRLVGPDAAARILSEPEGLRITLPVGRTNVANHVGLASTFPIQGDFEITLDYEIIEAHGGGVMLYFVTESNTLEALAVCRLAQGGEEGIYLCSRRTTPVGKPRQYQNEYHAAAPTRSGLLRLTRKGGEVTFSVAERPEGGFRDVYKRELGPEDVKRFQVAAYPGQSREVVDVRFRGVRVRAPEMPKRLDPLVAHAPPPRGIAVWLIAGLLVSGLIFALWARQRGSPRRRTKLGVSRDEM